MTSSNTTNNRPTDPALDDAIRAAVRGVLLALAERAKFRTLGRLEPEDYEAIARDYAPIDRSPPKPYVPPTPKPANPIMLELGEDLGLPQRHPSEWAELRRRLEELLLVDGRVVPWARRFIDGVVTAVTAGEKNATPPTWLRRLRYALSDVTALPSVRPGSVFELTPAELAPAPTPAPTAIARSLGSPAWMRQLGAGDAAVVVPALDALAARLRTEAPGSMAFLLVSALRHDWDPTAPHIANVDAFINGNAGEIARTLRTLGVRLETAP